MSYRSLYCSHLLEFSYKLVFRLVKRQSPQWYTISCCNLYCMQNIFFIAQCSPQHLMIYLTLTEWSFLMFFLGFLTNIWTCVSAVNTQKYHSLEHVMSLPHILSRWKAMSPMGCSQHLVKFKVKRKCRHTMQSLSVCCFKAAAHLIRPCSFSVPLLLSVSHLKPSGFIHNSILPLSHTKKIYITECSFPCYCHQIVMWHLRDLKKNLGHLTHRWHCSSIC